MEGVSTNTPGNFSCSCNPGYKLAANGFNCTGEWAGLACLCCNQNDAQLLLLLNVLCVYSAHALLATSLQHEATQHARVCAACLA